MRFVVEATDPHERVGDGRGGERERERETECVLSKIVNCSETDKIG